MLSNFRFVIFFSMLFFLICCASFSQNGINTINPPTEKEQEVSEKIVEAAKGFVGKRSLVVNGKRFNFDCTGAVLASYYAAGIDLWKLMALYEGNGVTRLYKAIKDKQWNKRTAYPKKGDLIFWDNTYDKNANGKRDDFLTHVGLVISSDRRGNIEYFHHHITRGLVIEKMNLLKSDTYKETYNGELVIVNSAIRAAGLDTDAGYLAGQLFRTFGQAWRIVEEQ